jgi:hypothetical protein
MPLPHEPQWETTVLLFRVGHHRTDMLGHRDDDDEKEEGNR